jgi:hypothetical protein
MAMSVLETSIAILAIICAASVGAMCILRWNRAAHGFKAGVYLGFGIFAGAVALLNLSALLATDASFLRTATLAYMAFATAILLPLARALGNLTYEEPDEHEDAAV